MMLYKPLQKSLVLTGKTHVAWKIRSDVYIYDISDNTSATGFA